MAGSPSNGHTNAYDSTGVDANGEFRIVLPTGPSWFYFFQLPQGYQRPKPDKSAIVEVVEGQPVKPIVFELEPIPDNLPKNMPEASKPAVVKGRVVDPAGKPVAGAEVGSQYTPDPGIGTYARSQQNVLSGEDGTYTFPILPFGKCHIYVGGFDTSSARSKDFATTEGSTHTIEDLVVRPATASISGKVVDEGGKPVPNLELSANSPSKYNYSFHTTTDEEGKWKLQHVMENEDVTIATRETRYVRVFGSKFKPNTHDNVLVLRTSER